MKNEEWRMKNEESGVTRPSARTKTQRQGPAGILPAESGAQLRHLAACPNWCFPAIAGESSLRASETPVPLATNPRRCARQLAFTRKGPTFSISPALVTFRFARKDGAASDRSREAIAV